MNIRTCPQFGRSIATTLQILQRRITRSSWIVIAVANFASGIATATPISLIILVQVGDTIDGSTLTSLGTQAFINDIAEVAFWAEYVGGHGLFTKDGAIVRTGDSIDGCTLRSIRGSGGASTFSFYNDGTVAFLGSGSGAGAPLGGQGIYTQNRLVVEEGGQLADGTVWDFIRGTMEPEISDSGIVAFGGGSERIVTDSGPVVESGDIIDGNVVGNFRSRSHRPSVNNQGTVAFRALGGAGVFTQYEQIMARSDFDFPEGPTFGTPTINNRGDVAFSLWQPGGMEIHDQNGLLIGPGATIDDIEITGLPIFTEEVWGGNGVLNDHGELVAHALWDGGTGIFTQYGAIALTGQRFDDYLITSLSDFGPLLPSINNSRQVAFYAELNGRQSIVMATVPEPSTLVLFGIGLLGLGLTRTRPA